jgi:lipopolysaccharide export system protein LptA
MRLFEGRMAEIKFHLHSIFINLTRYFICLLICISVSQIVQSQDTQPGKKKAKKIEILNANLWEVDEKIDKDLQKLKGDVHLKHNDVYMSCDSAYYYQKKNQVRSFGKIHIEQGDTLHLYGDYLFYDGAIEFAYVEGHVELIDRETHLYTDAVTYDFNIDLAQYNSGGRITNGDNTLTSRIGIYYVSKDLFHFKDSVKIVNPDYIITADTMDYNTESETAFFTGPSELTGDSLYLYCERGWYDTKNDITRIWKNALIDNRQQVVRGDSLYYENETGFGECFRNLSITDTTDNIIVKGNYAWYYKEPERFMVTDSAMFIQVSGEDSLFLHSDTLRAVTVVSDSAGNGFRLMSAYYKCKIFSKDIQAKCDSLSYSFRDSVIRLYEKPVIWSEENQLTSDSMAVFTKNRNADRMELYNTAFVVSQVDTMRFNQTKGRSLTGYFRDNKLYKITINGNGESTYYLVDNNEIVGVNRAKCASMDIFVDNGKVTEIFEYQQPEGMIDPPSELPQNNTHLDGFLWLDYLRPKKIEDIFK